MDGPRHLFFLTNTIFFGFVLSALYGALSAATLWQAGSTEDFRKYVESYFLTFNSAVSGGLVFGTAFLVHRTRRYIPGIIESVFTKRELEQTSYFKQRLELFNWWKPIVLSAGFAAVAGIIFYFADFPFDGPPEFFLMTAGCLQYAAGVYIGRQIFHTAHLLRSIESIRITKDIFSRDRLSGVFMYVNSISTATAITVYIGVRSYYYAPFTYNSVIGKAVSTAMLLPAIIAIPVLLFAYHSKNAIRRVYEAAIDFSIGKVRKAGTKDGLSEFQIQTSVVDLERSLREELNYRLRTTLEDLPMAVVVGIALLSAVKS
jgi:hypothetical protein